MSIKTNESKYKNEKRMTVLTGLVIAGGFTLLVVVLYGVTGAIDVEALRWYSVVATLAIPLLIMLVWRIAVNSAREHLRGVDKGVEVASQTLVEVGRGLTATASATRAQTQAARPPGTASRAVLYDDLLPRPAARPAVIRVPNQNDDEVVI